jgi:hypothetical protein
MKDYIVVKKHNKWIIRKLWFTLFKKKIYTDLKVCAVVNHNIPEGIFIDDYKPSFSDYESAIFGAEFIMEHTQKVYKGFTLEPVFEQYDDYFITDKKLYVMMRLSWCKVGTYLELTGILDDLFRGSRTFKS